MVNSDYCLLLGNFTPTATITAGDDTAAQHTGALLDQLAGRVMQMAPELQ